MSSMPECKCGKYVMRGECLCLDCLQIIITQERDKAVALLEDRPLFPTVPEWCNDVQQFLDKLKDKETERK